MTAAVSWCKKACLRQFMTTTIWKESRDNKEGREEEEEDTEE